VARIGRKCSATWGVLKARDRLSRASPTLPASGRRRSCGLIARAAISVAALRGLPYTVGVSLIRDSMDPRGFISGLAIAAALASAMSASAVADGRRVALVIGNGAYRSVPALPNPPNDAGDVTAALKRLGFEVTRIPPPQKPVDRKSFSCAKYSSRISPRFLARRYG
jgi:hypothetical protein